VTSSTTSLTYTILLKGQKAPFDGALFSPDAVAKILSDAEDSESRCQLVVDKEVQKTLAKCNYNIEILRTELESHKKKSLSIITQKDLEIQKLGAMADAGKWNWLWATGGLVGGILLTLGVVSAVNGIQR